MTEPIYIVSGFPRSGTSMMMRAIEAGGLPCVYTTDGDDNRNRNTLIPGYIPNPHGFYENAKLENWPQHRGKCLKVMWDDLFRLPNDERLAVVYIRRDPDEIKRSYYGIMSGPHPDPFRFLDGYAEKVADDIARLVKLAESVAVLDYSAVVSNPKRELSRLGWPINIERAAAVVDPSLYRHRGAA